MQCHASSITMARRAASLPSEEAPPSRGHRCHETPCGRGRGGCCPHTLSPAVLSQEEGRQGSEALRRSQQEPLWPPAPWASLTSQGSLQGKGGSLPQRSAMLRKRRPSGWSWADKIGGTHTCVQAWGLPWPSAPRDAVPRAGGPGTCPPLQTRDPETAKQTSTCPL